MQSSDLFCKSFVREFCHPTALFLNIHRLARIMNVDTNVVTAICDKMDMLLSSRVETLIEFKHVWQLQLRLGNWNLGWGYRVRLLLWLLQFQASPEVRNWASVAKVGSKCNYPPTQPQYLKLSVPVLYVISRHSVERLFLSPFVAAACNLHAQAVCQLRYVCVCLRDTVILILVWLHLSMPACLSVCRHKDSGVGGDGRLSHKSAVSWDSEVYLLSVR